MNYLSILDFIGCTNILLMSYSYMENSCLFTKSDVTGNFPVRLVAILFRGLMILVKTWLIIPPISPTVPLLRGLSPVS